MGDLVARCASLAGVRLSISDRAFVRQVRGGRLASPEPVPLYR